MILMHVHALQFQRFAIQQKTMFTVKGHRPKTCCRLIDITHLSIYLHRRLHLIEIGGSRAPEVGVHNRHQVLGGACLLGVQGVLVPVGTGHLMPLSI